MLLIDVATATSLIITYLFALRTTNLKMTALSAAILEVVGWHETASIAAHRTALEHCWVMCPRCDGVEFAVAQCQPGPRAHVRGSVKRLTSPTSATNTAARVGPIPLSCWIARYPWWLANRSAISPENRAWWPSRISISSSKRGDALSVGGARALRPAVGDQ